MRTNIPVNNFASGQIDRDLKGRFELPLQQNGCEIMKNFYPTIKGCAVFRPGFEFVDKISNSALYEFKFNKEQSYLLVIDASYINFYSYKINSEFVRVLDNNSQPLKITHPWGNDIFDLHFAQNNDVVNITSEGKYAEYKLTRTAANAFKLEKETYTGGELNNTAVFPEAIAYYESRLIRSRMTNIYGSKGGVYNNLTVGTGTNDAFKFDLAEANSQILWLVSGPNSLIAGTKEGILAINGGSVDTPITPDNISAKMPCYEGASKILPVKKDKMIFYVSQDRRSIYAFKYDVLMEQFSALDLNKANAEITKGFLKKLAYKFDQNKFLYSICGKDLISLAFSEDENVNAWATIETQGEFIDFCSISRPDGANDLFVNVKRRINGKDEFYLERLSDLVEFSRFEDFIDLPDASMTGLQKLQQEKEDKWRYYRIIAEELRNCNYLDSSIKYNGLQNSTITLNDDVLVCSENIFKDTDIGRRIWYKTVTGFEYGAFDIEEYINPTQVRVKVLCEPTSNTTDKWYFSATVFSGLEHLEGEIVSVVGNGGYLGDFQVQNGRVDISTANVNKVGSAIIGLKYLGMIKSCNLGMVIESTETLTKPKNIYNMTLRLCFSAGGKVGDSLYDLKPIQQFNPAGLYDTPPLPIDNDISISFTGEFSNEKHYFIIQDQPLPFKVAMVVPSYFHSVDTYQ